ncbi:hypothetical protein KAR91_43100 [Candidatus Pacearchaeota archaeon]|nr:hypothetical protein [Candidatus Pacearchaeota archaeon]
MIVILGKTSSRRLNTCCPELHHIVRAAANDPDCPYDFGVICGYRGKNKQNDAFLSGKSDAKFGQSDHNVKKGNQPWSEAVDLGVYSSKIRDYLWDDYEKHLELSKFILKKANDLGYHLEWGGNYDLRSKANDVFHYSLKFKRT